MFCLMCIVFLIFVPWKKGPEWYLRISPAIFYVLVLMNYLIIPLANLGLSAYYVIDPKYDLKSQVIQSWVVFYNVVNFSRVLEYFFVIRRTILLDAKNYLAARKAMLHARNKAEESQHDPNSEVNQEEVEPEQIKKAEEAIRKEEMLEET